MPKVSEPAMAVDTAKYIVKHVGSGFCEMIEQEKTAMSWAKPGSTLTFICCARLFSGLKDGVF